MFVVEILLVGPVVRQNSYSYFSTISYERGSLVRVPLRNGEETGVVLESKPALTVKTALRAATFSLRKLPVQEHPPKLSQAFVSTVDAISRDCAVSTGAVMSALLPEDQALVELYTETGAEPAKKDSHFERAVLSDTARGRVVTLKGMVREAFAMKQSVLVVAPTRADCERLYRELKVGILDRTVFIGSGLGKTKKNEAVSVITKSTHPILVISTPAYAHIERPDIGVVVLEGARSLGYHGRTRPYLNFTETLATYARIRSARLIYADTLIATEHEYYVEEKHAVPLGELRRRIVLPGTLRVVTLGKDNDSNVPFKIFGSETIATMQHALENDGRVFVFSARKGLASLIGCLDCGHILRDPSSGTPLSLHASSEDGIEKRWLYSAASGYRIPASDMCPVCGSWRLRERGIGVQAVMRELQEHFPKKTPLLFDHTTASTHKKARAIEAAFYEQGGTILVGTSFALPYIEEPVECSVIASMDSLLALPSWRQAEEAFGVLLSLREKTIHTVVAQTRHNATHDILEYAASGDTASFYANEFALRKQYLYPPYAVFVLLSYRGKKAAVTAIEHELMETFKEYEPQCYGTPFSEDGLFMRRCLMRFPRDSWPDEKVIGLLKELPPHIKLEINPDRII